MIQLRVTRDEDTPTNIIRWWEFDKGTRAGERAQEENETRGPGGSQSGRDANFIECNYAYHIIYRGPAGSRWILSESRPVTSHGSGHEILFSDKKRDDAHV